MTTASISALFPHAAANPTSKVVDRILFELDDQAFTQRQLMCYLMAKQFLSDKGSLLDFNPSAWGNQLDRYAKAMVILAASRPFAIAGFAPKRGNPGAGEIRRDQLRSAKLEQGRKRLASLEQLREDYRIPLDYIVTCARQVERVQAYTTRMTTMSSIDRASSEGEEAAWIFDLMQEAFIRYYLGARSFVELRSAATKP